MDAGQNKAHAHPYGSSVIPLSATPPVVVPNGPPPSSVPPVGPSLLGMPTQQEMIDYAINILVETIAERVVERVNMQLAPVIDRMMWAIEVMRTNGQIEAEAKTREA